MSVELDTQVPKPTSAKIAEFLNEDPINSGPLYRVLSIGSAVGGALLGKELVDHDFFHSTEQYEKQIGPINELKDKQATITKTEKTLGTDATPAVRSALNARFNAYQLQISTAEAHLPSSYHPHEKGWSEAGGAILYGSLIGVLVLRVTGGYIKRHLPQKTTTESEPQLAAAEEKIMDNRN